MRNLYPSLRIKLLFCWLLLGTSYAGYSQSDGGQNKTDKTSFSLPSNSGKNGANVLVGGVPVNLYTGAASPSMSLYSLPGRSLAVPVSLTYVAGNGVQVLSQASEVGTGWQLSAGGEITCEVRGTPDELVPGDKEWLSKLVAHDNDVQTLQNKICADEDTQYDIYHANCAGMQVNFAIRGPYGGANYEVFALNNRTVVVTPQFATWGNTRRIVSFTVTDAEGTRYVFDESAPITIRSATLSYNVNSEGGTELWPASTITYTASWRLTRITSLGGENVYFTYTTATPTPIVYKTRLNRGWARRCDTQGNNCVIVAPRATGGGGARTPPYYETTTTVTQSYAFYLATVYTDAGRIEFVRQHARRDKPGEKALSEVQIADRRGTVVKRFLFTYDYFGVAGDTDPDRLRLKLTQVKELAAGCVATATSFAYQETASMSRLTSKRDYWGYFTTCCQPYILPRPNPSSTRDPRYPDLTPDAVSMQNCLLQRISSSTGSSTELVFEPHLDKRGTQLGGVRLKQVKVKDGFKPTADQVFAIDYTVFDRNNPGVTGGASSELVNPPRYEELQTTRQQNNLCNPSQDYIYTYSFSSSDALEPVAPDYVGYKWASIKFPNGSRSVYQFTNQADFPDNYNGYSVKLSTNAFDDNDPCHNQQAGLPARQSGGCRNFFSADVRGNYPALPQTERPYGVLNSAALRRGFLLEQLDLDSENRVVATVTNTYDFSQRDVVLRSAVVAKEQQVFAYSIYSFFYNVKFSDIEREWVPLQQQLTTTYDQRRGNTQSINQRQQLTKYSYANFMVSAVEAGNPNAGPQYLTQLTRVVNYPPAGLFNPYFPLGVGPLYYGNSLATVVTTQQFVKPDPAGTWVRTAQTEKEYLPRNSTALLKRTISYDYVAGGAQATGRSSVDGVEYDDKNNLVNTLGTDGIWTGIVWGYEKLLPIASVRNGRISVMTNGTLGLATAGHTSFENYDDDDWYAGTIYPQEAKTGAQSVLLNTPNSIYGPGKTFTLPSDAQHGQYNFSCWAKVPKNESGYSDVVMVTYVTTANGTGIWRGTSTRINSGQNWQLCRGTLNLDEPAIQSALSSGQTITVQCYPWVASGSGNVLVDEMRFHPTNARMSTTTYQPLVGKTSTTDENQVTTYYLYDTNNQLRLIKDEKGNIVKRFQSHLATPTELSVQVAKTGGNLFPGTTATFTATTADCADGITYTWNFGDGATQKGGPQQPHAYAQAGTYTLTVVAEAPDVNPVEATLTVRVTASLDATFSYTGSTYYDLCDANGNREASITAVPTGGCSPYTYRWETSEYQYNPWSGSGGWSPWATDGNTSATYYYYHSYPRYMQVHCIITDACGNTADLYQSFNSEQNDPNCPIYLTAPQSGAQAKSK
jgi:hypothetical protein